MIISVKHLKSTDFKEPMVMLSLKQYEALMQIVEDADDKLAIRNRANEEVVSQKEVEKKFKKKFKLK